MVAVFTVGPTAAAVIVTAVVDGRIGIRQLLRRVVLWRVGLPWYLVALLGIPLVIFFATIILPGALASFQPMSPVRWLVTYIIVFVLTGIAGGPLFEELGWRGFALPLLQAQQGPLRGTLLLGALWGSGISPSTSCCQPGSSKTGAGIASVGIFLLLVLALTPIMTWLYNRTRGSILLAILAHGSVNTAPQMWVLLFPSGANTLVSLMLAFGIVGLALIVVTHGRLGYPFRGEPVLPVTADAHSY